MKPDHNNYAKRLVKTPKLYFYDTGLACSLLDIKEASQVSTHFLRGGSKTIFITSHILDPLLENCDYIHVLDKQTITQTYSRNDFDELKSELFKEINEVKINIINDTCGV